MKLNDNECCFVVETSLGERYFLDRDELLKDADNQVEIVEKDYMLVPTPPSEGNKGGGLGFTPAMAGRGYSRMFLSLDSSIIGAVSKDSPIGKAFIGTRSDLDII